MPENPTPQPAAGDRTGWCCLLLITAPTLLWFTAARLLPERILWYPIWAVATVWHAAGG
ncbi:hypothetical protein [Streptomyces sp. NPDC046727]|uniref:hypothetical protein n=1 Tax=Streptomyces sp. NPDC046727 TaxID=3155373 RepID=UPI00340F1618